MRGRVLLILATIILSSVVVTALGVSQTYYADKTFNVRAGETHIHKVNVQNVDDDWLDLKFTVKGEYMTVEGAKELYFVLPPKTINNYVYINITIPFDVEAGKSLEGSFVVEPVEHIEAMVGMVPKIGDKFFVNVLPPLTTWDKLTGAVTTGVDTAKSAATSGPALTIIMMIVLMTALLFAYRQGMIMSKQIAASKKTTPPSGAFVASSGAAASTITELIVLISELDERVFEQHFGSNGNEFANWIFHHTKQYELYEAVRAAQDRDELLMVLRHIS